MIEKLFKSHVATFTLLLWTSMARYGVGWEVEINITKASVVLGV